MSEKESSGLSLENELTALGRREGAAAIRAHIIALETTMTPEGLQQFQGHLRLFLATLRETRTPPSVVMINDVYRLTFNEDPQTDFPVQ